MTIVTLDFIVVGAGIAGVSAARGRCRSGGVFATPIRGRRRRQQ